MERQSDKILDELLVLRVQDGDKKSLAILVTRWHKRLVAYAYSKIKEMDVAKDIVQDSWQAIVKGIYRLNDPARFRVWAFKIVTNKAVDWIREQKKLKEMNEGLEQVDVVDVSNEESDFGPIRRAVSQLPESQRTILTMFYHNDYSIQEIAEVLGLNEGTVKSRLFYARQKVKEIYETIKD